MTLLYSRNIWSYIKKRDAIINFNSGRELRILEGYNYVISVNFFVSIILSEELYFLFVIRYMALILSLWSIALSLDIDIAQSVMTSFLSMDRDGNVTLTCNYCCSVGVVCVK